MNRYETSTPRIAFGIAAVGVTTLTLGVSVIWPANMHPNSREHPALAASKATTAAPTGVVTASASIDAVAVHEQVLSTAPCPSSKPNKRPEG